VNIEQARTIVERCCCGSTLTSDDTVHAAALVDSEIERLTQELAAARAAESRLIARIDQHRVRRDEFLTKMGLTPLGIGEGERGDKFLVGLVVALELIRGQKTIPVDVAAKAAGGGE
jgi:hypothetical protein